jgi:hypothetical protein
MENRHFTKPASRNVMLRPPHSTYKKIFSKSLLFSLLTTLQSQLFLASPVGYGVYGSSLQIDL